MTNAVYRKETGKAFWIIIAQLVLSILIFADILDILDILPVIVALQVVLYVFLFICFSKLATDMKKSNDGRAFGFLKAAVLLGIVQSATNFIFFLIGFQSSISSTILQIINLIIPLLAFIINLLGFKILKDSSTFPGVKGAQTVFASLRLIVIALAMFIIISGFLWFVTLNSTSADPMFILCCVISVTIFIWLIAIVKYIRGWAQIKNAPLSDDELSDFDTPTIDK